MLMNKSVIGIVFFFLIASMLHIPMAAAKTAGFSKPAVKKSKSSREARSVPRAKAKPVATARSAKAAATLRSPASVKAATAGRHRPALRSRIARSLRPGSVRRLQLARRAPLLLPASVGHLAGLSLTRDPLGLNSNVAFALDGMTSQVLFEKNAERALPIASLTKLMTALVIIEGGQDMDEIIEVTGEDVDRIKQTSSRLPVGARLSRTEMLRIALMSSENRAASALGRNYPGGLPAFVDAMNAKARQLGMSDTRYAEPTGLSSDNVASARDLAKLVLAAQAHPLLGQYSTHDSHTVQAEQRALHYVNTNRLIGDAGWQIGLQKTGYIREAGQCLVMLVNILGRPVVMVFLDSDRPHSRFSDAGLLRTWLLDKLGMDATARAAPSAAQDLPPMRDPSASLGNLP